MNEQNTVTGCWWEPKTQLGAITVNGETFPLYRVQHKWSDARFNWTYHYAVRVANDWNQSAPFMLTARTRSDLGRKIRYYEHKLVKA